MKAGPHVPATERTERPYTRSCLGLVLLPTTCTQPKKYTAPAQVPHPLPSRGHIQQRGPSRRVRHSRGGLSEVGDSETHHATLRHGPKASKIHRRILGPFWFSGSFQRLDESLVSGSSQPELPKRLRHLQWASHLHPLSRTPAPSRPKLPDLVVSAAREDNGSSCLPADV